MFRPLFAYTIQVPLCVVSFTDTELISHSVEVEASSLYEAGALALAEFRSSGVIEHIGPAIRLHIEVRRPATRHEITVAKSGRLARIEFEKLERANDQR